MWFAMSQGASDNRGEGRVGPQRDRQATSDVLADAVLRVLNRRGVLGGFSLTEVSEEAQVDRALVYQYFGDRRELIRTALRRGVRHRYEAFDTGPPAKSVKGRWGKYLRTMVGQSEAIRLLTLLHLDTDPRVRLLPMKDRTLPMLHQDQEEGFLSAEVAPEGFLIALSALGYGYGLFRRRFADELCMSAEDLDAHVEQVLALWFAALTPTEAMPEGRRKPA